MYTVGVFTLYIGVRHHTIRASASHARDCGKSHVMRTMQAFCTEKDLGAKIDYPRRTSLSVAFTELMTECRGWHVTVATFVALPFAIIFVGIRTYMKARVVNAFWWDDCELSNPSNEQIIFTNGK